MNDDWTPVEDVLTGLRTSTSDAARAQRVRDKCHRELTRRPFTRPLESAVVGGFCAVYVSLLALIALRTHGLL